jgi:hypothetical protein
LPDGQVDARPVLDSLGEHIARLVEIVAGPKQTVDLGAVSRSLLYLIEVSQIRFDRVGRAHNLLPAGGSFARSRQARF